MKKDTSSIPSLTVDNQTAIIAKEKASVLNDQFQSVFTVEDLTTIPEIGTGNLHTMQPIQFSEPGIQMLLQTSKLINHQVLMESILLYLNTVPMRLHQFQKLFLHNY